MVFKFPLGELKNILQFFNSNVIKFITKVNKVKYT